MDFDTEFNYGNIIISINGYINAYENEKNKSIEELNVLGNISGVLTDATIQYHTTKVNCRNVSISRLGNLLNEITIVQDLPSDSKNILYDFYQTYVKNNENCVGINSEKNRKIHFMRQMVCNTNELIPHVSNLMSNVSMTSVECNCAASIICRTYGPNRMTSSFNGILGTTL